MTPDGGVVHGADVGVGPLEFEVVPANGWNINVTVQVHCRGLKTPKCTKSAYICDIICTQYQLWDLRFVIFAQSVTV